MIRGMITDMTHNSALITNAMLASYANEKDITYIQMIEPFIMYSFPNRIGAKIDISKTAKSVYDNFGLDIKFKVVEKISTCAVWLTANSYLKYKCCRTLINLSDTCHDRYLLCTFLFISRKLESEPFFPEPCICLAIQVDCPDM